VSIPVAINEHTSHFSSRLQSWYTGNFLDSIDHFFIIQHEKYHVT